MSDITMPCEDCEIGQSTCCRLVYARDIEAVVPEECWILRDGQVVCIELVGVTFPSGSTWTEEMCCLPCRIRLVIERTAKIP